MGFDWLHWVLVLVIVGENAYIIGYTGAKMRQQSEAEHNERLRESLGKLK